jgi:hypothetical protein
VAAGVFAAFKSELLFWSQLVNIIDWVKIKTAINNTFI